MKDLNKAVKDVGDALKEGAHRGEAEGERMKRSTAGDVMTPGEKAGSIANEVSEEAKAEFDKAKRNVRDST
jgi:hypothetical protein